MTILLDDNEVKTNKLEKIDGDIRKLNEAVAENSIDNKDLGEKVFNIKKKTYKMLERLEKMEEKLKELENNKQKREKEKVNRSMERNRRKW